MKKHRRDMFIPVADHEPSTRANAPADIQELMRQIIELQLFNPPLRSFNDASSLGGLIPHDNVVPTRRACR